MVEFLDLGFEFLVMVVALLMTAERPNRNANTAKRQIAVVETIVILIFV